MVIFNTGNVRARTVVTKAATIADFYLMDNVSGTWTLDAGGASVAAATSGRTAFQFGGVADCKTTIVAKTSTTAGSESFGAMARFSSNETGYATYYFARQNQGVFRLQKVVNGTFTTLASGTFAAAAGTYYTIIISCIGSAILASIDDGAGNSLTKTATDTAIPGGGGHGARVGPTQSTQMSIKNWQAEEV